MILYHNLHGHSLVICTHISQQLYACIFIVTSLLLLAVYLISIIQRWHPGTLGHWHTGTLAHWHTGTLAHWLLVKSINQCQS